MSSRVGRRDMSGLVAAQNARRWTANSVRLTVRGDGLVRMAAPCGEARTIDPEEIEILCARLMETAERARQARTVHELKLSKKRAEIIYPDIGALIVS